MGRDMGPILENMRQQETDITQLVNFARQVIDVAFEGGGLDGGEIQEMAVNCGLLNAVEYDPEKHGEVNEYIEPGDTVYLYADILWPEEAE